MRFSSAVIFLAARMARRVNWTSVQTIFPVLKNSRRAISSVTWLSGRSGHRVRWKRANDSSSWRIITMPLFAHRGSSADILLVCLGSLPGLVPSLAIFRTELAVQFPVRRQRSGRLVWFSSSHLGFETERDERLVEQRVQVADVRLDNFIRNAIASGVLRRRCSDALENWRSPVCQRYFRFDDS